MARPKPARVSLKAAPDASQGGLKTGSLSQKSQEKEATSIANKVVAKLGPKLPKPRAPKAPKAAKPKKDKGTTETAGRWTIWRLPWDSDASVPFKFPQQPGTYRLASVAVTIGPVGSIGIRAGLWMKDGAGNYIGKVWSDSATATSSDQVFTFAANLPLDYVGGGTEPFAATASLPQDCVILSSMSWGIDLDASDYTGVKVRGVSILTEALDDTAPDTGKAKAAKIPKAKAPKAAKAKAPKAAKAAKVPAKKAVAKKPKAGKK